jgi:hypothetical protein
MSEFTVLAEYPRFWIAAENAVSQVFRNAELAAAIAEYQFQREHGESPRFLGEKADNSLHDLTEVMTALSPTPDR